jgi:hypothetical protein
MARRSAITLALLDQTGSPLQTVMITVNLLQLEAPSPLLDQVVADIEDLKTALKLEHPENSEVLRRHGVTVAGADVLEELGTA